MKYKCPLKSGYTFSAFPAGHELGPATYLCPQSCPPMKCNLHFNEQCASKQLTIKFSGDFSRSVDHQTTTITNKASDPHLWV